MIALGSVDVDLDLLDQYSDLDFFVIVKAGCKAGYLDNLGWLTSIAPAAYSFQNTPDGYKLVYKDGFFCEFAVFDEDELREAGNFEVVRIRKDGLVCPHARSQSSKEALTRI